MLLRDILTEILEIISRFNLCLSYAEVSFNEFAENQLATKADMLTVKEELKADINRLDKELAVIKWVSFATFAMVSAGFIKLFWHC